MKKLFVNGELIATGNYVIEERDEAPVYKVKVFHDSDCELDSCNYWNEKTKFYSNHRGYRFDGECTDEVFENWHKKEVDGKKYYPVYMFEHSGIALSKTPFSGPDARWDSGLLGIAEVDNSDGDADSLFDLFFEEFQACMEGEVYGFKVVDEVGEVVDSCWRFYGKRDDILDSMYDQIPEEYGITREDLEKALENAAW